MTIQPTTAASVRPTTPTAGTGTPAPTAGVGATNSSITSAQASPGFCTTMGGWITSVVNAIRDCLAKIPCVGSCFARTPAAPAPAPVAAAPTVDYAALVKATFDSQTTGPIAAAPPAAVVGAALTYFDHIPTVAGKMDAFHSVVSSRNATDAIAQQFFGRFRARVQNDFKQHLVTANGNSTVNPVSGRDHGARFGQVMVDRYIRSDLVKQAAANHRDALLAAAAARP